MKIIIEILIEFGCKIILMIHEDVLSLQAHEDIPKNEKYSRLSFFKKHQLVIRREGENFKLTLGQLRRRRRKRRKGEEKKRKVEGGT